MLLLKKLVSITNYIKRNGLRDLLVLGLLIFMKKQGKSYFWQGGGYLRQLGLNVISTLFDLYHKIFVRIDKCFSFPTYSEECINLFKDVCSDNYKIIIRECDKIVENKFVLHSGYAVDLKKEGLWIQDPLTGDDYPHDITIRFFEDIDKKTEGDPRLLWEINRLQFIVLLAQGYVLSENEQYLHEIRAIIQSWYKDNVFKQGINWIDAQEIGVRMTSLILACKILEAADIDIQSEFNLRDILANHANFLLFNLSIGRATHNHLLTELSSLFIYSTTDTKDKHKYLKRYLATGLLRKEIKKQLNSDGLSAEGSTSYTFFVVDAIILANYVYRYFYNKNLVEESVFKEINRVISEFSIGETDFVKIGDADCGRYSRLSWQSDLSRLGYIDVINTLFLGTENRTKKKYSEELFWLNPVEFANSTNKSFIHPTPSEPVLFKDSGYLSYRHNKRNLYLRFGPPRVSPDVRSGHTHSDYLSFVFFKEDNPVFIDPGTYTYLGRDSDRYYLRSALQHNTLTLDGREFLDVGKTVFGIPNLTTVRTDRLIEDTDCFLIFSWFSYSPDEWVGRLYIFDRNLAWLILINTAFSEPGSRSELHEHYCVAGEVVPKGNCYFIRNNESSISSIEFIDAHDKSETITIEEMRYAPRYGVKKTGHNIRRTTKLRNKRRITVTCLNLGPDHNVTARLLSDNRHLTITMDQQSVDIDIHKYLPET